MKKLFIIIFILGKVALCNAQSLPATLPSGTILGHREPGSRNNNWATEIILYVVTYNSKEIKTNHLLASIGSDFETKYLSKTEAEQLYGPRKEQLVILATPGPDVKLFTLADLFDKYKLDKKYINLPVHVNNDEDSITNTSDILASDTFINTIEINKEKNYMQINSNKKFPERRKAKSAMKR